MTLFASPAIPGCLGKNADEEDLASKLARYPDLGRTAVDPIVTPGFLALTFDDGPRRETTPIIAETLARHRIQATFFCVGRRIAGSRDILNRLEALGHQIASHSFNHEPQPSLDETVFKQRALAVKDNIGDRDHGRLYFRFPFGAAGPDQLRWLSEVDIGGKHYRPVGWHVDSQDFDYDVKYPAEETSYRILDVPDAGKCGEQESPFVHDYVGWVQFVARKTKGGIMLFHDTTLITREKLEQNLDAFEHPEHYWASMPPEKVEALRRYYECEKADPMLRFEFKPLWSGAWPSLRD